MKKLFILISVVSLFGSGVLFAEHPASESSQASQVEAEVVKSPWSASVMVELGRDIVGKAASATSNTTYFNVGRSLWGDVGLKATVPVDNAFSPNEENSNIDRYFTLKDPYLTLSKKELLNVSDISVTGYVRSYLPVTENSAHRGRNRNPNMGAYRSLVSASKELGAWTLSATNLVQRYTYLLAENVSKTTATVRAMNPRWVIVNEVAVDYKVNNTLTLGTYVDFYNYFVRSADQASTNDKNSLEAVLKADLSLVDKLSTTLEAIFKAPNQNLSKWNESADARLKNTSLLLTLNYSLL